MRNLILFCGWFLLASMSGGTAEPGPPRDAAEGQGARSAIDLSGPWQFKLDPLDVGRSEKWFAGTQPYDRTIQVPGAWNAQGMAYESSEQLRAFEKKFSEGLSQGPNVLSETRESEKLFSVFPGPGWYRRKVTIPADWAGRVPWLVFGGVHREAEVWVNGQSAATHASYLTPFRIDLSRHAKAGETVTVDVRVDARRKKESDPLMGCLDTLDFLFVSWGGIHRPVTLEATVMTRIGDVFIVPQLATATAEIRLAIEGPNPGQLAVGLDILNAEGKSIATLTQAIPAEATSAVLAVRIEEPKLWSPTTPHLYTARLRLLSGERVLEARSIRFGMREFKVAGGEFLLNGKPIFLRGYGEDCIFPNSICPPAEKDEFRRRLAVAREYGFNYVRHHSWTPPAEYLEAADELGMMLQPEFPFAYRWDLPKTPEMRKSALAQWEAVIRLNRNHPSIVTWCMGNELYDSFDLAPEMYAAAKRLDPTRPVIDSDGCNFKHQGRATLDFPVVQFGESHSIGFQDGKYNIPDDVKKPVIAHEMGYFATLPDLSQSELFQGGLRPYWLTKTRALAKQNGMEEDYIAWLSASYRLQAVCLKSNMEAARRSRLRGTSVWLFQDYPDCAEGVVDMFLRPKALRPEEFRKFNAPTVLLLDLPRRNWRNGETMEGKFVVSRFEEEPSDAAVLRWELKRATTIHASGVEEHLRVGAGRVEALSTFKVALPTQAGAGRWTLAAELSDDNGKTQNEWDLWVFPAELLAEAAHKVRSSEFGLLRDVYPWAPEQTSPATPAGTDLLVTTRLGPDTLDYLTGGGRVFLLEPEPVFTVEKTYFRLSSWDGGGPSGTLLDTNHPALRAMPSDGWCDLQFYPLIQGSKTVLLDGLPSKIHPLVRCIDRPSRLANRAYLFEAAVGRGKLLVSGFNFAQAIKAKDPAGVFLFDRLVRYAVGSDFAPKDSLPAAALKVKGKAN